MWQNWSVRNVVQKKLCLKYIEALVSSQVLRLTNYGVHVLQKDIQKT